MSQPLLHASSANARHRAAVIRLSIAVALLALCLVAAGARASPPERYGVMGRILGYDAARRVVRVKVVDTRIPDMWNAVGKRPPKDIRSGGEYTFAVEPEGSVLRRTVIKTRKGWAADTTGTPEGFARAMASLPDDRLLGLSIEKHAGGDRAPDYKLMLVQVPWTREEFMERLDAVSADGN